MILSFQYIVNYDFVIKACWHDGERLSSHQVTGFVNPVLNTDYEDEDILETKRSFSGVFKTFVN